MFTVQNLIIAVWVLGGALAIIGNFRKAKVWLIPLFTLTAAMFFGFWYDSEGDTQMAQISMLVILSVRLFDDAMYFVLARLPKGIFNQPEPADPIKEIIQRILSFAITLGLIYLISLHL